ncbi:MAG TPA: efflux RND transporter periplasmic adaptor subunit [Candidatus Eisenbacteria bacterium]|nr:efflux RND transporter periplasmic adaptor subunit [Candidatus Eisenbacteria bacterium]
MTRTGSADLSGLTIDRDAKPPTSSRKPIAIALSVLILVTAAVTVGLAVARGKPAEVRVARAEPLGGAPGAVSSEVLTASGYVVARQRASVSTEVAGRLEALYVSEGSRVTQGQVLGILRNQDQKAAMATAKAALDQATASLAEAKANAREIALRLARTKELLSKALVSQADYDAVEAQDGVAKARVTSAGAEVESARSRLDAARIDYDKTFIRAPFAGAVLRKEAEVGEIVSPIPSSGGLTRGAIVTMANLASLEVEVDVNEGYVARVREGMRAEIALDAYPTDRYPGHARQIVPTADRQKATVQVKVAFDSLDARVLPEMGAKVSFLADPEAQPPGGASTSSAVWVPASAVRERAGRAVVYVVEDGRATMRGVAPRPLGPDRVLIGSGLAAGEMVVTEGPENLADKARVKVR